MTQPIVELLDITMTFGAHTVHKGITLRFFQGENVVLLGPSGTGKTVLLKLILGLLSPTKGTVKVMGNDLSTLSEYCLMETRRHIGMLFQGAALFDSLSVFENVAFPLREQKIADEATIIKIVAEKLSIVGLPGIEQKAPSSLSGGQKKRVGLARALATSPEVLLFDEPTTGLDPTSRALIDELIIALRDEHNIASIIVTHDMESAARVADRVVLISDGVVVADGPIGTTWESNELVQSFVNGLWQGVGHETSRERTLSSTSIARPVRSER